MISSKHCIILAFEFRSCFHFELVYVYGIRVGVQIRLLHVDIQYNHYQFLSIVSTLIYLGNIVEEQLTINMKIDF